MLAPQSIRSYAAFTKKRAVLFIVLLCVLCIISQRLKGQTQVDFAREIRPLLSDRCFACHGPDEQNRESNLRVDDLASLIKDRGGYQVLKPGDAAGSELLDRVFSDDPDAIMPPPEMGKPLDKEEKELLRKWIEAGAKWSKHWAYEKPQGSPAPKVSTNSVPENWIDMYVAKQLKQAGANFSKRADPITLLRRLHFDITGLPPSREELRDLDSEFDLDRVVQRLLASPGFGERMAIYWLDLVRYADTVGYHGDQDHSISPYRDYVVNAFNDNLPFDQFTIEQLAGDQLSNPTQEQIVASGYNRLLQTSHEGGVQPKEYLAIYQADRVRNVSAVWFGATIGCAQCHDHKYDPFSAKDFYSLAAFFADVDEQQHFKVGTNSLPTKRPPEIEVLSRSQSLRISQINLQLEALANGQTGAESKEFAKELQSEKQAIENAKRRCMITKSVAPREVRFLPRGNWLDESGEFMQPAIPSVFGELENESRSTRLQLATWLTDAEDGGGLFTARVFVNRLWLLLFGEGLSRSVEDFGGQGEPPTHPALLDRLAAEFVRSGWDVKYMIRLIVSSRTYQQSSLETPWHRENDPENRLLSRQSRFRLPAEVVRDISLSCSKLLVHQVGGGSVKPYQPPGYYRHLNFPVRKYSASNDSGQWRRGLYVHWQRQFLHPMLSAFDAPTREECTARRARSNTPIAALVWLNDPSFVEAAKFFAADQLLQTKNKPNSDSGSEAIIRRMFETATSRAPDSDELQMLLDLREISSKAFQSKPEAAEELLAIGSAASSIGNEPQLPEQDWATWTMVARAILNLSETYTRN
ncbi:MAG: PSD1 and planctomycete cytochrome C domain-containing protein [Planctomycetota bacterium]